LEALATFSAWITDGIRINWTDAPASAYLVTCVLFGGIDLSVAVGDWTGSATVNGTSVGTTGFQPDQIIVIGRTLEFDLITTSAILSIGFAERGPTPPKNHCSSIYIVNGAGTAADINHESVQYCARTGNGVSYQEITAIGATDFTATTRSAGGAYKYSFLALKYGGGVSSWQGIISSPNSTAVPYNHDTTTPGIQPQFAFQLLTASQVTGTNHSSSATGAGAYGTCVFDGTSIFTNHIGDDDAATPTIDTESFSSNDLRCRESNPAHTNLFAASFVSFIATGWQHNYTTGNATTRLWPTMAIGANPPPAAGSIPVMDHYYRRQRA
jgi:hypothetical protein